MKQEKNNILQSAKVILLGLIIAVGVSYVSAFVGPTADAPGNNVKAPLNSSETNQAKDIGSCTTGSCGGIAVGTFNAYRDSSFSGTNVYFGLSDPTSHVGPDLFLKKYSIEGSTATDPLCVQRSTGKVVTCTGSAPTVTLTATPTSVTSGGTSTISVNYTGSNSSSCQKSSTPSSAWSGTGIASQSISNITATTTFNISCDSGSVTDSVVVTVGSVPLPVITLTSALDQSDAYDALTKTISTSGITAISSVSTTDTVANDRKVWMALATTNATSCTYTSSPSFSTWNSGSATSFNATSYDLPNWGTNSFTITCLNSAGQSATKTVSFIVKGKMTYDANGSWTTPANITQIFFELWGAGAGGAGGGGGASNGTQSNAEAGAGGGGGESGQYNASLVTSASGAYTLTIGSGGTGGNNGNGGDPGTAGSVGSAGGNTTIAGSGLSSLDTIAEGGAGGGGGQGGDHNNGASTGGYAGGSLTSPGVGDNRVNGQSGIDGHPQNISGCGIDNDNGIGGSGGNPSDPNASAGTKGVGGSGGSGGQPGPGCGGGGADGTDGANAAGGRAIIYWPSM
ncbi:hypothetical protein IPF86_01910 [Candidatus Nomurabacteria bacterium]|nr:MAG: hypothetical protein IPF86_01910 [Candidatus Nomurabacteria bacterium]